jgi:diguanylate cyclase (GGDEF)-like protein
MDMGDLQHATYARAHKVHLMMWVGSDLLTCERETICTIAFLKEAQGFIQLKLAEMVHHFIRKLQLPSDTGEESELMTEEADMLAAIHEMKHMVLLVRFSQYNAFYHFLMGERAAAEQWNATAQSVIFASGTDFPVADHYVVQTLLLVDGLNHGLTESGDDAFDKIRANIGILKKFSDNCPENFAHKYHLLSAELSAALDEPVEKTLQLFRAARDSIGKNDFVQIRALINEREGRFWLGRGEEIIGKAFLQEAYYLYGLWGATRKLAVMEREYHFKFFSTEDSRTRPAGARKTIASTQSVSNTDLDINSITKSIQVISREIKTESLLKILMGILVENAGAQKGCFLLAHNGESELSIEAIKEENSDSVEIVTSKPYSHYANVCQEIVKYVELTRESVVLDDAAVSGNFTANEYIRERHIKSVLCLPMVHYNELRGIVYLENNLSSRVFTAERLNVLKILASQAAISIENAHLYETMEEKVRDRTMLLNEANEKLHELTLIDPLTHLNNRRFFIDYITGSTERYIQKIKRSHSKAENRVAVPLNSVIGVFLIDIDFFKEVNDTWGHAAGDLVLVSISKALSAIIRCDDYIVRWGGEEFLIILNNTVPDYLSRFAAKTLAAVKAASVTLSDGTAIKRTCSIGFTQVPFNGSIPDFLTLDQTIKISDYAMYTAKRKGRNRAVCISLKEGFATDNAFKNSLIALSKDSGAVHDGIILTEIIGT